MTKLKNESENKGEKNVPKRKYKSNQSENEESKNENSFSNPGVKD